MWRKLTDKEKLRLMQAYGASAKKERLVVLILICALICICSIICYDAVRYTAFTMWHISIIIGTIASIIVVLMIESLYMMYEHNAIKSNKARIGLTTVMDKREINHCYEILVDIMEYNVSNRCWIKIHKKLYDEIGRYTQVTVVQFAEGRYIDMVAFDKDLDYIYID